MLTQEGKQVAQCLCPTTETLPGPRALWNVRVLFFPTVSVLPGSTGICIPSRAHVLKAKGETGMSLGSFLSQSLFLPSVPVLCSVRRHPTILSSCLVPFRPYCKRAEVCVSCFTIPKSLPSTVKWGLWETCRSYPQSRALVKDQSRQRPTAEITRPWTRGSPDSLA